MTQLRPAVELAQKKLPEGISRLAISDVPMIDLSYEAFSRPTPTEVAVTGYGEPSEYPDVEREFHEEVTMLERVLEKSEIPIGLADWQKYPDLPQLEKMYEAFNRRNDALQVWKWYGIPWRYRQGQFYVIWPMGPLCSPVIHRYSFDGFINGMARALERLTKERDEMRKKREWWMSVALLLGAVLWTFLQTLLAK